MTIVVKLREEEGGLDYQKLGGRFVEELCNRAETRVKYTGPAAFIPVCVCLLYCSFVKRRAMLLCTSGSTGSAPLHDLTAVQAVDDVVGGRRRNKGLETSASAVSSTQIRDSLDG